MSPPLEEGPDAPDADRASGRGRPSHVPIIAIMGLAALLRWVPGGTLSLGVDERCLDDPDAEGEVLGLSLLEVLRLETHQRTTRPLRPEPRQRISS